MPNASSVAPAHMSVVRGRGPVAVGVAVSCLTASHSRLKRADVVSVRTHRKLYDGRSCGSTTDEDIANRVSYCTKA